MAASGRALAVSWCARPALRASAAGRRSVAGPRCGIINADQGLRRRRQDLSRDSYSLAPPSRGPRPCDRQVRRDAVHRVRATVAVAPTPRGHDGLRSEPVRSRPSTFERAADGSMKLVETSELRPRLFRRRWHPGGFGRPVAVRPVRVPFPAVCYLRHPARHGRCDSSSRPADVSCQLNIALWSGDRGRPDCLTSVALHAPVARHERGRLLFPRSGRCSPARSCLLVVGEACLPAGSLATTSRQAESPGTSRS